MQKTKKQVIDEYMAIRQVEDNERLYQIALGYMKDRGVVDKSFKASDDTN